ERYATCQELADDLRRWLDDKPIRARRPTPLQRVHRWMRRHRALVGTAAACVVAGLVLAVVGLAAANAVIRREQQRVQKALDEQEQTSCGHRVALAHRSWLGGDVLRARELLEGCPKHLRGWEWHYTRRLCRSEFLHLDGHEGPVNDAAFSPDGKLLASV